MFTSHQTSKLLTLLAVAAAMTGCTSSSAPAPQVATPTAAPSGATEVRIGPIAFGRRDPDQGDFTLWTARADGSHQRQLTTTPTYFSDWAPDGSGLIFDYIDGANEHVAAITSAGLKRTQLTFGPGIQEVPRYSPDGRHIVFDASTLLPSDPAFTADIWVMNSDGSHARQVTHGGFDVEPVFSPDGRHIAFGRIVGPTSTTDFTQNEAVYVVRTDGTGLRQVVAPRPALEHPRWSPDGRLLTFNIGPEDSGYLTRERSFPSAPTAEDCTSSARRATPGNSPRPSGPPMDARCWSSATARQRKSTTSVTWTHEPASSTSACGLLWTGR